MSPRENAQDKGRRYLLDGRLVVELAQPGYFRATVRGGGQIYCVTFGRGGWHCTQHDASVVTWSPPTASLHRPTGHERLSDQGSLRSG